MVKTCKNNGFRLDFPLNQSIDPELKQNTVALWLISYVGVPRWYICSCIEQNVLHVDSRSRYRSHWNVPFFGYNWGLGNEGRRIHNDICYA